MSFDLQLTNRRAFVTGGTKGVGAAVVEVLRDAGAKVVTTARSLPLQPTEGVRYIAADLSTTDGCAAVAASVLQQLGGIDIIVDVLGGSSAPGGGFAALDDTAWWKELNQNLMPAVRLDRALLPSMIEQGAAHESLTYGGNDERHSKDNSDRPWRTCPGRRDQGQGVRCRT